MAGLDCQKRINNLLEGILGTYDHRYGFGSMTCTIYDTAWIASISKPVSGHAQWLFPASFSMVLAAQLPDGGWPAHLHEQDTDDTDRILSTMAALYCLKQHAKNPLQLRHMVGESLSNRIRKAVTYLSSMLKTWRVENCKGVGFEILAPSLLDTLEDEGLSFSFQGKAQLIDARDQKLAKVRPEMLYDAAPWTLLHSLEAFHCRRDFSFDRIAHHKVNGSMMASPSATASYLIRCTEWDDEAEAYLRLVLSNGEGKGSGGVPSAYPSTNFELAWVVSTLLETGLWSQELGEIHNAKIVKALEDSRDGGNGLVGFAPGIEPDLDDSAKSSVIFSLLGKQGFASCILQFFDSSKCLKTYKAERNPSVSANCNALLGILLDSEPCQSRYEVIEKVTNFICDSWWNTNGSLDDKWNLSRYYPAMLMGQSLIELLQTWNDGKLSQFQPVILQEKVMPTLFQCLTRILQSQRVDGSWGIRGPREETAYAILALINLKLLPIAQLFVAEVVSAIDRGRNFLINSEGHKPEYLWIEKIPYGSKNLAEAYVIAALHTSIDRPSLGGAVCQLFSADLPEFAEMGILTKSEHLWKNTKWLVIASWIDGKLRLPILQRSLGKAWYQKELVGCHEMVAFRWIFANNRIGSEGSSQFLCDMISISLLNDRIIDLVDEAIACQDSERLGLTKNALYKAIEPSGACDQALSSLGPKNLPKKSVSEVTEERDLRSTKDLADRQVHCYGNSIEPYEGSDKPITPSSFVKFLEGHVGLFGASQSDKETLQLEVKRFILAQILRIEEKEYKDWPPPHQHTLAWSWKSLAAAHQHGNSSWNRSASLTGFPHIFTFALCLRSRNGKDAFSTASQKYIAENVRDCMATVFGLEPEMQRSRRSSSNSGLQMNNQSAALLSYEKDRLGLSMEHLKSTGLDADVLKTITLVADVADLAGKLLDKEV